MDKTIPKFWIPQIPGQDVHVIAIALAANGGSSYRDASAIARVTDLKWNAKITIITDNPSKLLRDLPQRVTIISVESKAALLHNIQTIVECQVKAGSCLLFTLSSHGYSTVMPERCSAELNGRSEYVVVSGQPVMDYELFEALYCKMDSDVISLCLIDTCHSGTMLDLEYISTDGHKFSRSMTPLKSRPFSVCISACNDAETAGEDISDFAGWGGKLTCQFVDFVNLTGRVSVLLFFERVRRAFSTQRVQASHPIISYSC